ncbi:MAG: hypothetical protein U0836_21045 [Pirellulales bacterium]
MDEAKRILHAGGAAWSPTFDDSGHCSLALDGRSLTSDMAKAIVAAHRINRLHFLPMPRKDVLKELRAGFDNPWIAAQVLGTMDRLEAPSK